MDCKIHGPDVSTYGTTRPRCAKCNIDFVVSRRKRLKVMAIEYKGGCCEACGYKKCVDAFDFHHTDPSQKDFTLSNGGLTRSWEKTRAELDKCILLCANCHRETHAC